MATTPTYARIGGAIRQIATSFRFWASQAVSSSFGYIKWLTVNEESVNRRKGRVYDNAVVAPAIFWYWRNLTYPRVIVERPGEDGKLVALPKHSVQAAIEHGPHYDHTVLLAGTMLSLIIVGNAYWMKIRNPNTTEVIGYAWVPHTRIYPAANWDNEDGSKLITHYMYTPIGGTEEPVKKEDVVHFRFGIDPENPMLGMSPLIGALRDVVGENEAAILTDALLINGGLTGIAISPKAQAAVTGRVQDPDPTKRDELKRRWKQNTQGEGAGTPNFFDFPVDVVQLGYSPDKYAMPQNRAIFVSRICAGIGLDPMILGLPSENKTYNNYAEALEGAWENTLLPTLEILAVQFTHQGMQDFVDSREGDRLAWDTSKVRALQPDKDKLFGRMGKAYQDGIITRAVALRELGYPVDETKDNVYYTDITTSANTEATAKAVHLAARSEVAAMWARAARSRTQEDVQE